MWEHESDVLLLNLWQMPVSGSYLYQGHQAHELPSFPTTRRVKGYWYPMLSSLQVRKRKDQQYDVFVMNRSLSGIQQQTTLLLTDLQPPTNHRQIPTRPWCQWCNPPPGSDWLSHTILSLRSNSFNKYVKKHTFKKNRIDFFSSFKCEIKTQCWKTFILHISFSKNFNWHEQ